MLSCLQTPSHSGWKGHQEVCSPAPQPLLKGQVLQPHDLLGSPPLNPLQLLHGLPSDVSQAEQSVIACIVLLAFPENGCNACLLLPSCGWDFRDRGIDSTTLPLLLVFWQSMILCKMNSIQGTDMQLSSNTIPKIH